MSILNTIKDKVSGLLEGHGDKIAGGLDKAGTFADDKTGGKYGERIEGGVQKAKDAVEGLQSKNGNAS